MKKVKISKNYIISRYNKEDIDNYHNKIEQIKSDKLTETKEIESIVGNEIIQEINKIIEDNNIIYNQKKNKLEKQLKEL